MEADLLRSAISALVGGPRHRVGDTSAIQPVAGLYAIYGDRRATLEIGTGTSEFPLYVGKAERNLVSRDVRTHFATGKTGSSTLRRTLAALLKDLLDLHAVPRNPHDPDGSANYSLETSGDDRLTAWMLARLEIATWAAPAGTELGRVETSVLAELRPPLNLAKMGGHADHRIKRARADMAAQARSRTGDEIVRA